MKPGPEEFILIAGAVMAVVIWKFGFSRSSRGPKDSAGESTPDGGSGWGGEDSPGWSDGKDGDD